MKVRLPLWGKPQGYATLDTEATKGATLGRDVYRADGSVVTEADLVPAAADPAAPTRTLWSLLTGIPDLLASLLGLATDGFVRKSGSTLSASAIVTADLPNDGVTYAKMQNVSAASKLLGRGASGAGDPEEISLGSGLTMTGSTLSVAGGGGGGVVVACSYTQTSTTDSTTNVIPYDNTIPQITEGKEFAAISTTHTPTDASATLEVDVHIPYAQMSASSNILAALFRDSTSNAIAVLNVTPPQSGYSSPIHLRVRVPANATVATTFKFRFGSNDGSTVHLNRTTSSATFLGNAAVASMKVTEYAP